VCSVVHKSISELERTILTTLFLVVQKTPTGGYMAGTTAGFLVEIVEALDLQSHCRIPWT
jgi:hypothetical protein